MKLLTPRDVSKLLNIAIRTVYDHRTRLGGFYPAGIRVLRFREDKIDELMEGQGQGGLAMGVSIPGAQAHRGRVQNQNGSQGRTGVEAKGSQDRLDSGRHGL